MSQEQRTLSLRTIFSRQLCLCGRGHWVTAPPSHSSPLQGGASAETSVPVGVCREHPDEGKCSLLHPDASCTLQSTCLGEAGTELQGSSGLQMPAMEWSRCLGMASQRKPNLLHNLWRKVLEDTSNGSIIPQAGRTSWARAIRCSEGRTH